MLVLKNFRTKISNEINNSNLPVDAVYFVLKDVLNEVMEIYTYQSQMENAEAAGQGSDDQGQTNEEPAAANIEKKEEK